ncbi:A24 family peptidase [Naasia sp. SYSU D00948]|uniref:prepilin peptidase n=1 Tax=Naasia sp. SYSU D00948 TaxID=2817379 RepID=UPI001B3003D4|nr:A24 family peptidase [Naasia sp. SYSU D00948]
MAAVLLGAFGSLLGSFLNVVIYRVPRGLSVVSPPSACPGCAMRIRPHDNVPVLSWLLLRGRCRSCRMPIPIRYPLVELGTAAAFAVVAVRFVPALPAGPGALPGLLTLLAFLYLAAITVALALIDLDVRRLPNALVLPAYVVGAALFVPAAVLGGDLGGLARAGAGMLLVGAVYLALALGVPGGMGGGDVKLAGVLGLYLGWLGWAELAVGAVSGFLLGGGFGVALLALRRAGRRTAVPFGPWMLAGAWLGILAGAPLAEAYLSLFGLGD